MLRFSDHLVGNKIFPHFLVVTLLVWYSTIVRRISKLYCIMQQWYNLVLNGYIRTFKSRYQDRSVWSLKMFEKGPDSAAPFYTSIKLNIDSIVWTAKIAEPKKHCKSVRILKDNSPNLSAARSWTSMDGMAKVYLD